MPPCSSAANIAYGYASYLLAASALAGKTADILVVIIANDNSPETIRFWFFDRF